jgi:cyclase
LVRERIAEDVYVFSSRRYAQVTAGAILTMDGVILIDTLFYPDETQAIKEFLEKRLGRRVRYVINTHYHADHTLGTWLFPGAQVVSHARCRELLDEAGRESVERMKSESPEFEDVKIILPDVVFERGNLHIYLGGKTVRLDHCPGHSPDLISVLIEEDQILFASDTVMPVPTLFDGSYEDLVKSLKRTLEMNPDSVVRGHGDVILRGEMKDLIKSDLKYLDKIHKEVENIVARGEPEAVLERISIESCGKSRVPLNGFVTDLHQANLRQLFHELNDQKQHQVSETGV